MHYNSKLYLIALLTLLLWSKTVYAQTKVLVISDPHVMASELIVNEGEAWTSYVNADRKLIDYSKTLFDLMVDRLKTEILPDLVLITGDLTKDGEAVSHQYVKGKLDELKAAGIPTLVITGNHDWGTDNANYYDGSKTTAAATLSMSEIATLYGDYGFGSTEREMTTLTYACEPIAGLVVIGIDSGCNGQLSSTTLDWVCDKAKAACHDGKKVLAMMHHPLIPHFTDAENFIESMSIDNYATVRNALADAGVRIIFTGHFHTSDIAMDYNADLSKTIYDVNTGSLISYPNDYRTIMMPADFSSVTITTSSMTEISPGDGFASTAKSRLHTAVENMIKAKGAAYAVIAGTAADAFIFHTEGDEADNADAQETLSTLISVGKLAKTFGTITGDQFTAFSTMANSMLKDLTNYGVAGRENQTADRTLAISLDAVTNDGEDTALRDRLLFPPQTSAIYTLQGIKVDHPSSGIYISNGRVIIK